MNAQRERNGQDAAALDEDDLRAIETMREQVLRESGYHYMSHLARHLIEKEVEVLLRCVRALQRRPG